MTHLRALSTITVALLATSCVSDPGSEGPDGEAPDDGDGSVDPGDQAGPDDEAADADVLPTYPSQHPRIYLGANRDRLQAALAARTPAAVGFQDNIGARLTVGGTAVQLGAGIDPLPE